MLKTIKKFKHKLSKISENMRKTILTIAYLNRFIGVMTIMLYATFILGFCAQIVLGAFQIISFLILLLFLKHFSKSEKRMLLVYFLVTAFFFLGWYLISEVFKSDLNNHLEMGLMILIPMSIAVYFTYILEKLKDSIQ